MMIFDEVLNTFFNQLLDKVAFMCYNVKKRWIFVGTFATERKAKIYEMICKHDG